MPYRDVVVYNQKAIVADRKFLAKEGPLNLYAAYRTHNYHFAIYGAMFLGQYTPAMTAARELIRLSAHGYRRRYSGCRRHRWRKAISIEGYRVPIESAQACR